MSTYVFSQASQAERDRLLALEDLFDTPSIRYLGDLGVGPGWQCLEVGCGAGGVALWLAGQVGPGGRVVATDLEPRILDDHGRDNLEVLRHDILTDPLPEAAFDLAHARAVLEHIPDRRQALARMVSAVRPGGWVVAEDLDFSDEILPGLLRYLDPPGHAPLWQRVGRATQALFAAAGADSGFGARLPAALRQAGLADIGAELHAPVLAGGWESEFYRLSTEHLRDRLAGTGIATASDIDQVLALTAEPAVRHLPFVTVTAWGRRPRGGEPEGGPGND